LYQYLKKQEPFLMSLGVGSTLKNLQKIDLANVNVFYPNDMEQIKIEKFL